MKLLIRSLLVWLLLLAVPFQGFASATMLLCAPPATAAPAHHDHAAMLAAQAAGHQHQGDAPASHDHHAGAKCGQTGACCVGAAIPPAIVSFIPAPAPRTGPVVLAAGFLPSVDLAGLERPPQFLFA